MSLKDLFGKTSEQIVTKKQLDDYYNEAESEGYVEELIEDKDRFLPSVDFSSASNFARYGSAEKYYVDAIKNIYQNYPYDGSKKEKQEWRNNSSQLDLYIFDNIYPLTTGYINLSSSVLSTDGTYRSASLPQYVKIKGGPNQSPTNKFETANIYDLNTNRESNLGITAFGNTVEFWFKDNLSVSNAYYNKSYALFDLWNNESNLLPSYTRLSIEKIDGANKFAVTYRSGSAGVTSQILDYTFDSSEWHHYAFTFSNFNNSDLEICLFIDGNLVNKNIISGGGGINLAYNLRNIANIGLLRNGLGASYGSFDEFRFWKVARTSQQIYRNWHTTIGGGSNTDDSNTDLGIYLKFNEGIVNSSNISDIDTICLDYSGRVSNGTIINYNINCRSTGSAIDEYFDKKDIYNNSINLEQKDPIIFSSNPLVEETINTYSSIGNVHDAVNTTSINKSLPTWIIEEAEKKDYNDLSSLIQIMASYFDTLHLQIEAIAKLKNIDYDSSGKPKPFAKKLLSSSGFENLEIFNDTTFLENVLGRNENEEFNDKIHNIKNVIYQNIYNNLSYIYKTKGTEKSLRNLIRCFGIDDELIKINVYANNVEYDLSTRYTYSSTPKKFVDFNDPDRYDGYIYQKAKAGDPNTKSFIPGTTFASASYIPLTFQAEVIFPKNPIIETDKYSVADFTTVSIFGVHEANCDPNLIYDTGSADLFNFQVYAIKSDIGSSEAYFKLTGSFNGESVVLTSSLFKDVYENQKWNFAIRIKPENYQQTNLAAGSQAPNYNVEFVGINSIGDEINNQFKLSDTVSNSNMLSALQVNKRVYAGAHYTNFDPDKLEYRTDVKISSVRAWLDYLNDEELIAHSYEPNNFGRQQPNWLPAFYNSFSGSQSIPLTRMDMLVLHWNFFNVTASDSNGQFIVDDASSGSVNYASSSFGYNWINETIRYQMPGFADEFFPNDNQVINKEYVFSGKKQNPETLSGNDMVQIVDTDDVTRTKDSRAISYYISIEKSMSQVINDEIMNWFATIKSYNNLIGQPSERYKKEYSALNHLRELFFNKVNNRINFEKFFEFYKWIDSSLSMMINQLIPASANASDKVRNIVESHMLERSKYENKLPTIEIKAVPKSTPFSSHLEYNYIEQSAGQTRLEQPLEVSRYYSFKPQWLKQRAIRTDAPVNTSLEPQNDIDREVMRQLINHRNIDSLPILYEVENNTTYEGREDVSKIFTKVYKLSTDRQYIIEDAIIPINIENIPVQGRFIFAEEIESSSSINQLVPAKQKYNRIGNYQRVYEQVFVPGRTNNNKSFVELEGNISGTSTVNVFGMAERALPVRKSHKNIIVERFSAPGGPEVNGRGYLDAAAEEYSVYNSLNYRNSIVRKVLNSWLAESSSIDADYPSYHKVNKNPFRRIDGDVTYDNEFVTHQIPQSDAQYAWLASALNTDFSASAFINEYSNLSFDYAFLSQSQTAAPFVNYRIDSSVVGLTVDVDSNTVLLPSASNYYLSILNGPYQGASWKFLRNAENPAVIQSRKNNKIIVQDEPFLRNRQTIINDTTYLTPFYPSKESTFTAYREPPVSYNRPMEHSASLTGSNVITQLVSTYKNNKEYFANSDLTARLKQKEKSIPQTYDILKILERTNKYKTNLRSKNIKYKAQIFPTKDKAGLIETRSKPNYAENAGTGSNGYDRNAGEIRNFWRDDIEARRRSNAFYTTSKTGSLNVMNIAQISASTTASTFTGILRWYGNVYTPPYLTASKNYNSNYSSIFSLDANINTTQSMSIGTAAPYNNNISFNIKSYHFGELDGFDEIEARNFLAQPSGTYFDLPITRSDKLQTVEAFKYDINDNFVIPKISYINKIHFPSFNFSFDYSEGGLPTQVFASNTSYFINYGFLRKTNILAGKNPWYNSYDKYFEDLRPLSLDKTILPEYNFSENSEYYIQEKNGDVKTSPPLNYISFIGTETQVNSINNAYNITDRLNNFILNDYDGKKKIKINVNGVKKLLPYKGFYPQERTAQLASLFQKSFWNISMNDVINGYPTYNGRSVFPENFANGILPSGSPLIQQMQTLLQPYFAPGILFNTIKAGIAMDWPSIYTSSKPDSVNYLENKWGPDYKTQGIFGNPFFYTTASFDETAYPSLANNYTNIYCINTPSFYRIPFESLIDLRGFENNKTLYYLDPTRVSRESFIDSTPESTYGAVSSSILRNPQFSFENINKEQNSSRQFKDNTYKLAINNFLAEVPKFFLQNQSLTAFTSKKPVNLVTFIPGKTYEMYLKIEKDNDVKMILDSETAITYGLYSGNTASVKIPAASTFGPPTEYILNSTAAVSTFGYLAYDAAAFAPYAPPYYYGPQQIKFTFIPEYETYDSFEQIINNLTVSCEPANEQINNYFSSSAAVAGGDTASLLPTSTAYKNKMPLTSSVNYNVLVPDVNFTMDQNNQVISVDVVNDPSKARWRIQTKFETPILNFNTELNRQSVILNSSSYFYGFQEPSIVNPELIALKVNYETYITPFAFTGMWGGYAQTGSNSGVKLSLQGANENPANNIYSLAKVCDFQEEGKYVGQIAATKEISEAILMIPFTRKANNQNNNLVETIKPIYGENKTTDEQAYYFKVKPDTIDKLFKSINPNLNISFKNKTVNYQNVKKILNNINPTNSILKSMKGMVDYVIPPHLDWIYNRDIEPFAMYILEFKHVLDGGELADIWQGVMPRSAMEMSIDNVTLEHDLTEDEIFHGKTLPDDIQWKVFKIKKRAAYEYATLVNGQDERYQYKTVDDELAYSYNWPYDYFSLVELVNIEAGLEVETSGSST